MSKTLFIMPSWWQQLLLLPISPQFEIFDGINNTKYTVITKHFNKKVYILDYLLINK